MALRASAPDTKMMMRRLAFGDSAAEDFRLPTSEERAWLSSRYPDSRLAFRWPTLIIETNIPPKPLPLTVAGVAAKFVPPPEVENGANAGPVKDNLPTKITNDYMNMRAPLILSLSRLPNGRDPLWNKNGQ